MVLQLKALSVIYLLIMLYYKASASAFCLFASVGVHIVNSKCLWCFGPPLKISGSIHIIAFLPKPFVVAVAFGYAFD